jgi:hypothetical protein
MPKVLAPFRNRKHSHLLPMRRSSTNEQYGASNDALDTKSQPIPNDVQLRLPPD